MVSNENNWIRFFEIPDVSKHKKGFTIYKVVSMLYPEKSPESITKITVWKRFNDFKKLHREMKSLHHTLRIRDKFPSLPSATTLFFKRFNEEVIQNRKQMISNFLYYISEHSQLFTSNGFVKFFESSHTPTAMLNSTINSIRAELNLPEEPEYLPFHSTDSDEDCTMSDTDSVSTMSSLSSSFVQISDNIADQIARGTAELTKKLSSDLSLNTSKSSCSETDSHLNMFDLPDSGFHDSSNAYLGYVEDADKCFSLATEYEVDKKYSEALDTYRNGIYLLLKYIKDEKNSNKQQMIQYKTAKYLIAANKIYSLYLTNDKKAHQEFMTDPFANSFITHFSNNLCTDKLNNHTLLDKSHNALSHDYQILDYSHTTKNNKQTYISKAEHLISLAAQLESENKYAEAFSTYNQGIYMLLKHVKDDKDHDRKQAVRFTVEKYSLRADKLYNLYLGNEDLTKEILEVTVERPLSDLYKYKVLKVLDDGMMVLHTESQQIHYIKVIYKECIFSDDDLILPKQVPFMVQMHNYYNCENALFLILQYCSGLKLWDYINTSDQTIESEQTKTIDISDNDSEYSFSDIVHEYTQNILTNFVATSAGDVTIRDAPKEPVDIDEIIVKSQELIVSVNETLKRNSESKKSLCEECKSDDDFEFINAPPVQRKLSETSDCDVSDVEEFTRIPKENVIKWSAQLLLALEKLHKSGVICCDLQSKNILINEKGDLVLTYMCRVNRRRIFNYNNIAILAPEVYRFDKISAAADWWSYGTILYEMLTGMPISYIHPEGISSYTMLKVPKFVSVQARSLLKQLLTYDAPSRLGTGINGTEEIKSHPFFNTVCWDALLSQ